MPTKRMQRASAKQLVIELLGGAGEPLPAKELATRIIESGRCTGLKGKTPEATISAMLAVGSKPGGPFKRVAKGIYALADGQKNKTVTRARRAPVAKSGVTPSTKAKRASRAKSTR